MSVLVYKSKKIIQPKSIKGFTLVELLIAISMIAILTGVLFAVINPKGIQAKARDSQRVSDLAKIKVALENYFADNRSYPYTEDSELGYVAVSTLSGVLVPNYINKLPEDPKLTDTLCDGDEEWRNYGYKTSGNGKSYILVTAMETYEMGGVCDTCTSCAVNGSKGNVYFATPD